MKQPDCPTGKKNTPKNKQREVHDGSNIKRSVLAWFLTHIYVRYAVIGTLVILTLIRFGDDYLPRRKTRDS